MYDPLKAKTKVVFYAAIAFLFGLGTASGLGWTSSSQAMPTLLKTPQVPVEAVAPAMELSNAFTTLASAVTPAVVRIESRRQAPQQNREVPEAFRRFFDIPDGQQAPPSQGQIAGGSGFIVSEDGYILTNNHVVEGADEVRVFLADRRYFDAKIVGTDPYTDVAVIKIDAGGPLKPMAMGDSENLAVGEWVLAIGNPGFGASTQLDFTVTAGIISARGRGLQLLQRDLFEDPQYGPEAARWAIEDFIQTDAVINPGNSGGPMVNLRGQVVGINSAIASTTGAYQGYGFAIPINLAHRVMEDLIEYGHVQRPRIGVSIQDVVAEDAAVYGLPSVSGILVQTVDPEGPSAGSLEPEDVIVALDDKPVGYTAELQAEIAERHPGDEVKVTVYRDGKPRDVEVTLDAAPINDVETTVAEGPAASDERLGISVQPVDREVAQETGLEPGGIALTDVIRGSAAARRGVGTFLGNKLVQINDTQVESTADVREALDDIEAGGIASLTFEDANGVQRVVNVRMP